jgi:hypothetical protein
LKIIHEVEKNPGEKRVDIAKRLRLPASTLNSIFAKNDIREQIQKCGNACKKRKTDKESTFAELETMPFTIIAETNEIRFFFLTLTTLREMT